MKRTAKAGFTLVEVLVAMVIFAISTLATTNLMIGSMQHITSNRHGSEAVAIAQSELERVRRLPFADIVSDLAGRDVISTKSSATFHVTRTVQDNTPQTGLKEITVTVSWIHKGETKSYETKTLYTQIVRS
jgi:prepilin-type N-terminal cleavage/methylation domain-containing protein